MPSICHFPKPILMLIYYSFFDAITDIYGKFIQTKERMKETVPISPFLIIFYVWSLLGSFFTETKQYNTIQHNLFHMQSIYTI